MKVMIIDQIAKVNYKYSYSLAQAMANKGHEIILAIDQKKECEGCECAKWNLFNADEKKVSKFNKLKNYILSYKAIEREIRSGKYDVIHTQWVLFSPIDFYYLYKIKQKNRIKFVVTIHDILPFNKKIYDYIFHKKIYELADSVIVQADNNIRRFNELFPKMANKEVMIPHGHFLEYAASVSKEKSRKYLNIPQNKIVFLFFGQIKKVKGVGVLLEAFAQIKKEYSNILLVIAGSVWKDNFSQYQDIIIRNNMNDQVRTDIRYIPEEEVRYYYSSADLCVLPYLDVYQSGVIQLCYAYKKPVIATRIGAFEEVVIDGETGFMCEPDNSRDLASVLRVAINSIDRFDEMGQKGYEYIADKFSWNRIANKVNDIYLKT